MGHEPFADIAGLSVTGIVREVGAMHVIGQVPIAKPATYMQ
jgi:hypothetical protein